MFKRLRENDSLCVSVYLNYESRRDIAINQLAFSEWERLEKLYTSVSTNKWLTCSIAGEKGVPLTARLFHSMIAKNDVYDDD